MCIDFDQLHSMQLILIISYLMSKNIVCGRDILLTASNFLMFKFASICYSLGFTSQTGIPFLKLNMIQINILPKNLCTILFKLIPLGWLGTVPFAISSLKPLCKDTIKSSSSEVTPWSTIRDKKTHVIYN